MSNICPNFVQYLIFSQAFKLCLVPVQCLAMSKFCPIFVQRAGISVYVTACPKFVQFFFMSREREGGNKLTCYLPLLPLCTPYCYWHRENSRAAHRGWRGEHVLNCVMARQGQIDDCCDRGGADTEK